MYSNSFLLASLLFTFGTLVKSQDSIPNYSFPNVDIVSKRSPIEKLNPIENLSIYSGKKNEVIVLSSLQANLVSNNTRQIFARVPGVTIWENDGSGTQVGIAVRGLSPNRSWELNTRQNGYDISSDIFGYPEAYFSPPMEAVEKIQLIRGGAALQFGSQFGGVINYIVKREKEDKPITFETQNTVGSYGLFSSYNAIGGNYKKWSYYGYHHFRTGNGWRENSKFTNHNSHAFLKYSINKNHSISFEYSRMNSLAQQAGGLTDEQFRSNPRLSVRNRNWMEIPWNVASINIENKINSNLNFNTKIFGLIGGRNSVGFIAAPNIRDSINTSTQNYNLRRVDQDAYQNIGFEIRGLYQYNILKSKNHMAFGIRGYSANTRRQQNGKGDSEQKFSRGLPSGIYPTEINYLTLNHSIFIENQFSPLPNFFITPGLRFENVTSRINGRLNIANGVEIPVQENSINRSFPLFGLGIEKKFKSYSIYSNISQSYRPILFSELTPPTTLDIIDVNLKDGSGYTIDLGFRGNFSKYIDFDLNAYYLSYQNKIGNLRRFIDDDQTKGTYQFRTNLGDAIHRGIDGYFNVSISELLGISKKYGELSIFNTTSLLDARYENFEINTSSGSAPNSVISKTNLKGKDVEYAPRYVLNLGLTYTIKELAMTIQNRTSSKVYSDANNTKLPSLNGITGEIEGYSVYDFSCETKVKKNYKISFGINNFTDTSYTTRRSGGYPGPGILPGDGRTFYISIGGKW
jgi:Fe(3+) dicitrate transport protein